MQFIDLAAQQKRIRGQIEANLNKVLDHGQYVMGPEVAELEHLLAAYVGVRHAVACSSGTDALLLALMARGIGPGDAVFTSPFTFIATAEVISMLGATPVFVDIEPETFNLDPALLEPAVERARGLSLAPKGIIGVDLFGLPADYDRIRAVARGHGLFVIEDAAQSFGAAVRGKMACGLADVGCTSFFPAKPLGCYGDGGMCFTDDPALADTLVSLRNHGQGEHKYDNVRIGMNGRLDTLQAAVLLAKFQVFPEEIELRRAVADRYGRYIEPISGLTPPRLPAGSRSAWAQYTLMAESESHRGRLMAGLKAAGVPTAVYYPTPLHLQPAFGHLGYKASDFPISEDCCRRVFSLPMHPYLTAEDQHRIVAALAP